MAMMAGPRPVALGLGVMVLALLCTGTAAAVIVPSAEEAGQQVVAGGGGDEEAGEAAVSAEPMLPAAPHMPPIMSPAEVLAALAQTTTTAPSPPSTTMPAATATSTTAMAQASGPVRATTTTVRPLTLTDPPLAKRPLIVVDPTSGPSGTNVAVTVSGAGCRGEGAGVAMTMEDPQGRPLTGDGAAARPDGTWSLALTMGANLANGLHVLRAQCMIGSTVLFHYEPAGYHVGPLPNQPVVG